MNATLEDQIDLLNRQIEHLYSKVDNLATLLAEALNHINELQAQAPKRGPGRPPKQRDEQETATQ